MARSSNKHRSRALTPRQRAFAHAIASGRSASAAYREVYNAQRMSDAAVRVEASRLRHHPNVALLLRPLNTEQIMRHI